FIKNKGFSSVLYSDARDSYTQKISGSAKRYHLSSGFYVLSKTYIAIAAVDCVRTKAKPKKRMAGRTAAHLFVGFFC
ncbi:MAG: hypothetical protein ACK5C4_10520, partial [Pseudanabaena sp.]